MPFIPFIFFTALTVYWWHRHKTFDVCVYMSSLYAFISFCCLFLVYGDMLGDGGILFDEKDIELNFIPTALFCLLIALSMLPFSLLYSQDLKRITVSMSWVLDIVSWGLIAVSLLNLYLVADSTLDILQGDLDAVRQAHYEGVQTPAQLKAESMPSILKYLYYLNMSTILSLPLFFYYLCFEKEKAWWFKVMLFFSSLSFPIAGIQAADRTEFTFYAMMMLYCLIFYRKFFTKTHKRILAGIGIPFLALILIYVVSVSVARFEDRKDGGAATSALQYAGQGYLNFCFFWEKAKFDEIATEREFPLINHTFFKIDSNADRRGERAGKQGFHISVFATFIGDVLLDLSPIGVVIWTIFFFLVCMLVMRKPHREELTVGEVISIYVLAGIPIFGVFYYKYYFFQYTLMFLLCAFMYFISKYKLSL